MRLIISFVILCWLTQVEAMDINSTLDDMFQEYARHSLPRRPRTGVLYNASLPSNFTGVQVSIVRLRRDSFWGRGANYSGFHMPPRIFTRPASFTRLDLVYSNLGNLSSYYYSLPNYTLVTPVVGFHAYASPEQIGTPVTKLNLTLFGDPILVQFSLPQAENAKCVLFYSNGTFEITNMTLNDMCAVRDQGHLSIVVKSSTPKHKEIVRGKNKLWKWWVFGFGVGVVGVLLFGFIIFIIYRALRMKKVRKMEKEAEKNEGLDTTNVGPSKMPSATVVRTQPVIENDYVP